MTERSPDEIQRDIQRTRARMSADIDALEQKLDPDRLKDRARAKLKDAQEAAVATARNAAEEGARMARNAAEQGADAARRAARRTVEEVRENPRPAAMVAGAALGLLLLGRALSSHEDADEEEDRAAFEDWRERRRMAGEQAAKLARRARKGAGRMAERVSDVAEEWGDEAESWTSRAGHRLSELAGSARDRIRGRRQRGLDRFLPDSPWLVGGLAALAGAAVVAVVVRRTRAGRELGDEVDEIVPRATSRAGDVAAVATSAARSAGRTAEAELETVGPELEESARQMVETAGRAARRIGGSAVDSAREEAERRDLS